MGVLIDLALKAKLALESRATTESLSGGSTPDSEVEARRQRVMAMLADHPEERYAVLTDTQSDPEAVLLTLAIRGHGTCELRIVREKWDGVLFLEMLERHTIH